MASRSYEIDLPDGVTPAQGLELVRTKAGEVGIRIEGDELAGTFEGMAQGRYRVDERTQMLTLAVDKKPAFLPWSMIESGLRKTFGEFRVGGDDAKTT